MANMLSKNIVAFIALLVASPTTWVQCWSPSPVMLKRTRVPLRNGRLIESFKTLLRAAGADDLQDQARKLREEVEAFERTKREAKEAVQQQELQAKMEIQQAKDFYSAVLPILKPDGSTVDEKVEFTPVSKNQDTCIVTMEGELPLGMILEEGEAAGTVVVDQVAPDSNAAKAGIVVGDILRACTACKMNMEAPTWQLIAGGIGRPKIKRMVYSVDRRPFEEVMDALGSNRMDPEGRPVILVVERSRQ